ncbi:glycosyltransferase [Planktomarina temperata]|nr:glycosyltransferase [Planktomarina temperata]
MDYNTPSSPTGALHPPRTGHWDPPDLLEFLTEANLLPPATYLQLQNRDMDGNASESDTLISLGLIDATRLAQLQAERLGEGYIDLTYFPPNPDLLKILGPANALQMGVLPWRLSADVTVILTDRPEHFDENQSYLRQIFGPPRRAFTCPDQMRSYITTTEDAALIHRAEHRVAARESCRDLNFKTFHVALCSLIALVALAGAFAPAITFLVFALWGTLTLIANMALKLATAMLFLHHGALANLKYRGRTTDAPLPKISIMVPLFKESAMMSHLLTHLRQLDYPKNLLQVILVMERDDITTAKTLAGVKLPPWITTINVPNGTIKTKPRALNYALDHCRGSIIGVYDAEDAPEPGQLRKVARHFAESDEKLACVQGTLDFYNSRSNWLSRCFTIEYATWFRIVLPGLARLKLPVPLGGTTLFFRRHILEELGGWDAHNVTEDADLGIRLTRFGYHTELLPTVTLEEANCRGWPWIRQRSRWLKGYAVTWAVHMRAPKTLLRDLGLWQFFGVQLLFAGTLSQFLLAPVLWTFWLAFLALPHPLTGFMPSWAFYTLGGIYLMSEVINIIVGMLACNQAKHRHLLKWVPSLHFYFPLGSMAAYKGFLELLYKPFYWDKTAHGISLATAPATPLTRPERPHHVSGG